MTDQNFYNNCELWAKSHPKEAVLLPYLEVQNHHLVKTKIGEPNLAKTSESQASYYHSQDNAYEEAQEWFKEQSLADVKLLCVYGIGLGYYYYAVQAWLHADQSRQLVFLEDDLEVIHFFFQTPQANVLLKDPQVQLLYFREVSVKDHVLEDLYWNAAMSNIWISSLKLYLKAKPDVFTDLKHKLTYDFTMKNALVDEYLEYGARFFYNFYQNIHKLPKAYLGNKMYGKFKNVPAIICGAGPSLTKHLPLLPHLVDKALIFAGGSAMNALNSAGIKPHLGAGIDPNPAQLERIKNNTAYEVPFFYRNRMNPEALNLIRGGLLYITGCGGYDVAKWYEENLGIYGEDLDEGHNVVNFSLQTAKQLGCNPIIFIGVDLGFTDHKTYAPGIEDNVSIDIKNAMNSVKFDDKPILKEDIYGRPFYTLWKWIAESEWISEFARDNPDFTLINCTEGGLGFPGVVNKPLLDVIDEYLTRQYPIAEMLHGEIQNSKLWQVTFAKVLRLTYTLEQSLRNCLDHLNVLLNEASLVECEMNASQTLPKTTQSGLAALAEIELGEEPGYKYVLEVFNAVKSKLLQHEIAKNHLETDFQAALNKIHVNIKRLSFLKDVAMANIALIEMALTNVNTNSSKKNKPSHSAIMASPEPQPLTHFHPIYLPQNPKEGMKLPSGHIVRITKNYGQKNIRECRLEIDGILDGQCLLYYPNGSLKAEMFYAKGNLHGPVTFYSSKGKQIAHSLFLEGKRTEVSCLYFKSGSIYASLNFKEGRLDGIQQYFYEKGSLKSLHHYKNGAEYKKTELFSP